MMQMLDSARLSHEINMAPMIDVLLVLLVVFMLSMTIWRVIPVNVPPEQTRANQPQEPPIVLDLRPDHTYALNSSVVAHADLATRLTEIYQARPRAVLFIRAAGTWRYGEVIEAADLARGAGVQVIGYMPGKE